MELKATSDGLTLMLSCQDGVKALRIDFANPKLQFRIKRARHQGDPLIKAFGLTLNKPAFIVDGTAGLGQDAFLLAAFGHSVTLFEKHDLIFQLLQDAIQRALHDIQLAPIVKRLTLHQGDACHYLASLKPDYIYLDPMFPEKKKSALSKQSMEILKHISDLSEQPELLTIACASALKRVVVKRPKHAPYLGNQMPSFSHRYQSCRFDVYMALLPR